MDKTKRKTPIIRFKGFNDDWEQRKLGEVANFRRGSFPQPYGNVEWYDGEGAMPFVQVVDVTNNLVLVSDTKQKISRLAQPKSIFVPKGKVVVTLQGSIGRVAITQYDCFVDRTLLIFESYNELINERFWAYTIQLKFDIEKEKAPGGTIKTITKEALSNFVISLPCFEEQKKIGEFLSNLDNLITLHQRKLDKLGQLKKTMLANMFPKTGEVVPELRFMGFTDAWEQRKLNTFSEYQSSRYSANQFADIEPIGSYPVFDANNQITCLDKYDQESAYISIIKDGAGVGRVALRPRKSSIIGTMGYILPKESDLNFVFNVLQNIDFNKYISGSTIPHVYYKDYGNAEFSVPTIKEQELIGKLFQQLDNLITLHQRKLESLQELKKTMLKYMFV